MHKKSTVRMGCIFFALTPAKQTICKKQADNNQQKGPEAFCKTIDNHSDCNKKEGKSTQAFQCDSPSFSYPIPYYMQAPEKVVTFFGYSIRLYPYPQPLKLRYRHPSFRYNPLHTRIPYQSIPEPYPESSSHHPDS